MLFNLYYLFTIRYLILVFYCQKISPKIIITIFSLFPWNKELGFDTDLFSKRQFQQFLLYFYNIQIIILSIIDDRRVHKRGMPMQSRLEGEGVFPPTRRMRSAWLQRARALHEWKVQLRAWVQGEVLRGGGLPPSDLFRPRFLRGGHLHMQEGLEGSWLQPNGQGGVAVSARLQRPRQLWSWNSDLPLRAHVVWRRLLER